MDSFEKFQSVSVLVDFGGYTHDVLDLVLVVLGFGDVDAGQVDDVLVKVP